MHPFPPSIVNVLLHESRHHDLNDEVRAIRERSVRSRIRPRRRYRLREGTSGWVSVSTVRPPDGTADAA
jgi:hypothetical protein